MVRDPLMTEAIVNPFDTPPNSQPEVDDADEEETIEDFQAGIQETLPFIENNDASLEIIYISDDDSVDLVYESASDYEDEERSLSVYAHPGSTRDLSQARENQGKHKGEEDDVVFMGRFEQKIREFEFVAFKRYSFKL